MFERGLVVLGAIVAAALWGRIRWSQYTNKQKKSKTKSKKAQPIAPLHRISTNAEVTNLFGRRGSAATMNAHNVWQSALVNEQDPLYDQDPIHYAL